MQDLCSTDPPQETCGTVVHTDHTAPIRQHELDHTDPTDQDVSYLEYLDHEVGIYHTDHTDHTDHLSEGCGSLSLARLLNETKEHQYTAK